MKTVLFFLILSVVTINFVEAQKSAVNKDQPLVDVIKEDFSYTIDPETTEVKVQWISSQLNDIGINHDLSILSYDKDNRIVSLKFRQFNQDGSKGLGCMVGKLISFTIYACGGKLACKSE